jgi:hypothetical protein
VTTQTARKSTAQAEARLKSSTLRHYTIYLSSPTAVVDSNLSIHQT